MTSFDPYRKWLGIPPKDQPPNHYRLLSLELFESDPDVIEGAADRAMGFIRQYQSGEYAPLAAKVLNEIAAARLCLLKSVTKSDYDSKLRKQLAVPTASNDRSSFAADDEFTELMKTSKVLPKPKGKKATSSAKPSSPKWLQWPYVAAAICAGIVLLSVAMFAIPGGHLANDPPGVAPAGDESDSITPAAKPPAPTIRPAPNSAQSSEIVTQPRSTSDSAKMSRSSNPPELKLPEDAIGPAVDLIQPVDLARDVFAGNWKKESTAIVGNAGGKIYLPVKLPEDYQLRFGVRRTAGNETLMLGFVMAGRAGAVAFDGYGSSRSGLYVDGTDPIANCTTRHGGLLKNDQLSTIALDIHSGHFKATVDENVVIDWYGDPDRMYLPTDHGVPNRESPFAAVAAGTYRIESASMIPIKPEPIQERLTRLDAEIDVMSLLDLRKDVRSGVWNVGGNVLNSPDGANALGKYSLPVAVPEEYTLTMNVETVPEANPRQIFVIGLLANHSYCTIPILNNDGLLGLELIDGARWHDSETSMRGKFLSPGKPAAIACTVTKQRIRMEIDGRTLIDWVGDTRRLSVEHAWSPTDARKLFLGTETRFKFSKIKLGPPIDAPNQPIQSRSKPNHAVDLLSLVDPKRDALEGTWTKEKTMLRVTGESDVNKLVIPCDVPSEYKLTIRVAREKGGRLESDALILNLPVDSHMTNLLVDGFTSTLSGLQIDRVNFADPNNVARRQTQVIPLGGPRTIVVTVRKTGVKLELGTKEILNWVGNPNRLWMDPQWSTPAGRIALCSWSTRFRLEKMELEPLETAPFPPVAELGSDGNLMSMINVQRDSRKGQWNGGAEGISSPAFPGARLTVPVTPPERYVMTADVERLAGGFQFCVGLIVGGHQCSAVIDGGGAGNESGLERLDGKKFHDTANLAHRIHSRSLLPNGKRVKVRCLVRRDSIVVMCDDQEAVRWRGDPRRLSLDDYYLPPNYSEADHSQLWLGAWDAKFLIRELSLEPLGAEDEERIQKGF